ncbi:GTP pyrophosphokinase [Alphaproteobacteria bacterium]|nr:GTP pyrophosphokinase [Alphaproteobacteria bacterium]
MLTKEQLAERVLAYDAAADTGLIARAYDYGQSQHEGQFRHSGEPFFIHPLAVAEILTHYHMDPPTIAASLLHDAVEDTDAKLADISARFGPLVAELVDGVTKLTQIDLARRGDSPSGSSQTENLRKLVLATSRDIRVLLIKLADRLHNMRTLVYIADEAKRRAKALETLDIYANLAERIGLEKIHQELQDIAFATLNPDAYASITARLEGITAKDGSLTDRIIARLGEDMLAEGLDGVSISGRTKSPYSIWRKMAEKNRSFEQLGDVVAFRILVDTVQECYHALGIVHTRYQMIPTYYDDYISTPKPNGYRSLHTCVIGPERQRIEVQIRTREMHHVNEYGVAAHWSYKQGAGNMEGTQFRWLRELLEVMNTSASSEEFLENTKLSMYRDQVFVFSPKGDLVALPQGATPVDFAYAVHSGVGNRCIGAKVNGLLRPLSTTLANGDQVEILTSKMASPSAEWERFCVTPKAKSALRRFLREQQRDKHIELGRQALIVAFRDAGREFSDKAVEAGLRALKATGIQEVYAEIGDGRRQAGKVVDALYPPAPAGLVSQLLDAFKPKPRKESEAESAARKMHMPKVLGLIPGMSVRFAKCCHPLPGDAIIGVIHTGSGVSVHRRDCVQLKNYASCPERFIEVAWNPEVSAGSLNTGRLRLQMTSDPGSLGSLSILIAKLGGNICNLITLRQTGQYADVLLDVEIRDAGHLTQLIAQLRASPIVSSVDRVAE